MTPEPRVFRVLVALLLTAVLPLGVASSNQAEEDLPTDPPPIIIKPGVRAAP